MPRPPTHAPDAASTGLLGTERVPLGSRLNACFAACLTELKVCVLSWCLDPGSGVPWGTTLSVPQTQFPIRALKTSLPADPLLGIHMKRRIRDVPWSPILEKRKQHIYLTILEGRGRGGPHRAKPRCHQAAYFWRLRGKPVPWSFPASRGHVPPLIRDLFFHLQIQ